MDGGNGESVIHHLALTDKWGNIVQLQGVQVSVSLEVGNSDTKSDQGISQNIICNINIVLTVDFFFKARAVWNVLVPVLLVTDNKVFETRKASHCVHPD